MTLVGSFFTILTATVGIVTAVQALRKESILRRSFDWTSEAMKREESDVISNQLNKMRMDYFAQLRVNEEMPRTRTVSVLLAAMVLLALTVVFGMIYVPGLPTWVTVLFLAFLCLPLSLCIWQIAHMESSRNDLLREWRYRLRGINMKAPKDDVRAWHVTTTASMTL